MESQQEENSARNNQRLEVVETAVIVGPVVNIEENCVIEGDVNTSSIYNIKLNFKGDCNFISFDIYNSSFDGADKSSIGWFA